MALRTVARETSYVVMSSRSEGIAASGPELARRQLGEHVAQLHVLGPRAVLDPGGHMSSSRRLVDPLVRSGTYQLESMAPTRRRCQGPRWRPHSRLDPRRRWRPRSPSSPRPPAAPSTRCCPSSRDCASSPQGAAACCSSRVGRATTPRSTAATCSRWPPASRPGWPRPASPPTTARGSTSPTRSWSRSSQSGATAEIVETQEWARACGAATVAVTNVAGSPLADAADLALVTQAGPELAVPATKTYLTQLVALAVLADALAPDPAALDDDARPGAPATSTLLASRDRGRRGGRARWPRPTGYVVVGARAAARHRAGDRAEARGDLPAPGARLLLRRPAPRPDLGGQRGAARRAGRPRSDGPLAEPMARPGARPHGRGAPRLGIGGDADFAGRCDLHLPGRTCPRRWRPSRDRAGAAHGRADGPAARVSTPTTPAACTR